MKKINGQLAWNCECSCSNHTKKIIAGGELRREKTKSCGCYRKEFMSKTKSKNLIGKVFGELTVLEDSGKELQMELLYINAPVPVEIQIF